MARNFFIVTILCGLIITGVMVSGCTTTKEGEKQVTVDKNSVLGPGETVTYTIRISGYSATDFVLTSDKPVNIDSDWMDLDHVGVTNFSKRIYYSGNPQRPQGFSVPLPGDRFRVINPDPNSKANVHITLTGVKLYESF